MRRRLRIKLSRLLVLLLLLAPLALVVWWVAPRLRQLDQELPEGVRTSIVYTLPARGVDRYPIGHRAGPIRLLANAALRSDAAHDRIYPYAVDYTLLQDGRVVHRGRYHFRGRLLYYRNARSGELQPTSRYDADVPLRPTATEAALIDAARFPQADRLELSVAAASPEIDGIDLRLYLQPPPLEARRLQRQWLRMARTQQEELARDTIYPPELLTTDEVVNLMRSRWRPVGPLGGGFRARRLHSLEATFADWVSTETLPPGLLLDATRRAVFPLPPGSGRLELSLTPAPTVAGQPVPQPAPVQLRWFGVDPAQRASYRLDRPERPLQWSGTLAPGLLELSAQEPLLARLLRHGPTGVEELTPERGLLRLYRADGATPLEFSVAHVGSEPTPCRIDLRALGSVHPPASTTWLAPLSVQYELLDAGGARLSQGLLQGTPAESLYDRPSEDPLNGRASEPLRQHLWLPARAATLRLQAAQPAWIAVYTRPPGLAQRLRAPDDYLHWRARDAAQPAWFALTPRNYAALVQARRSELLQWQSRPPQDDPDLLAGRYQWEDFLPQGRWRGHALLVEREPQQPVRTEAQAGLYRPLAAGGEQAVQLGGPPAAAPLQPQLIYLRPTAAPAQLQAQWDGRALPAQWLTGRYGRLPLPPSLAGMHRLRLQGGGAARLFLSHAAAPAPYQQVFAAELLAGETLRYRYRKQGVPAETLSLRLFTPAGAAATLAVRLQGLQRATTAPTSEWTLEQRLFELAGGEPAAGWVLDENAAAVSGGRRLYLPLGSDQPPGEYTIDLSLAAGQAAHVLLYRVTPGAAASRKLVKYRLGKVGDD